MANEDKENNIIKKRDTTDINNHLNPQTQTLPQTHKIPPTEKQT